MMYSVVLQLKFRPLPSGGPPAGAVRRGVVFIDEAQNTIYVSPEDYVVEAGGWFTLYPLGRVAFPNVWVFARMLVRVDALDEEAWVWAVPVGDPVIDLVTLADVWTYLTTQWPARTWTLAELRDDTGQAATVIKNAWPEERPRRIVRTGGTDEDPVYEDQGPDPALPRVAVYRGIGAVRRVGVAET